MDRTNYTLCTFWLFYFHVRSKNLKNNKTWTVVRLCIQDPGWRNKKQDILTDKIFVRNRRYKTTSDLGSYWWISAPLHAAQ